MPDQVRHDGGLLAERGEATYVSQVPSALYNRNILRLAASIPHLGRLEEPHARVERQSPVCGSRVAVEVRLDAAGRVSALGQEVKACALGQASAALMGSHAIGRTAAELAEVRDQLAGFLAGRSGDLGDWPGLAALAPARDYPARHASVLLAFEAAAAAAEAASMAETG